MNKESQLQQPSGPDAKLELLHPLGSSLPHDSAVQHVCGSADYIEDLPLREGELFVCFVGAPCAKGRLTELNIEKALNLSAVVAVLTADDIPGHKHWGPIMEDEPLLVVEQIDYLEQPVCIIAAETKAAAFAAKKLVQIQVETQPPVLSIEQADSLQQYLGDERQIGRGDVATHLASAEHVVEGSFIVGGQEQFYLESQAALAEPRERDEITIYSSTQNPTEVQKVVAETLGLGHHQVVCTTQRMGGAFGGKETQGTLPAAMVALVAQHTRRPARIVYDKAQDMRVTGKRHETLFKYRIGVDDSGCIIAADFIVRSNGGAFMDLSTAVLERTMLHLDNAYYLPHVRITARVCRTNLPPNTAFRGFGGPQGMAAIEYAIETIAQALDLDALDVRKANLYSHATDSSGCETQRNVTPYGQTVEDELLPALFRQLEKTAKVKSRKQQAALFNTESKTHIRGVSMVPVKFGISFTNKSMNQGNALVNVYTDGTVQVSTGATEMGQGVNSKIQQIVAEEFGISPQSVIVMPTSTEKNNNTSPTAASASADINGAAAVHACDQVRERLSEFAATLLPGVDSPENIHFSNGAVYSKPDDSNAIRFAELTRLAHLERIDLGARGFYATPDIDFDRATGKGTPFYYFTNGCCAAEVLIDRFTGELSIEQVDVLMDIGQPINWEIERGQVIGGLVQGIGWVTTEKLHYSDTGELLSDSPTTYKIPNISDLPHRLSIDFIDNRLNAKNIRSTKAVGEPPLMLATAVFTAIMDALNHVGNRDVGKLTLPATHEEILRCISERESGN